MQIRFPSPATPVLPTVGTPPKVALRGATPTRDGLARELARLDAELVDLRDVLRRTRLRDGTRSVTLTGGVLSVAGTHAPAVLRSSQPVSLQPATYSETNPEWEGNSTAGVTVGGTYNGTEAMTLTFVVNLKGHPRLEMYDEQGNMLQSTKAKKQDASGTTYQLSNGLTLTIANGVFLDGDSFTLNVYPPGSPGDFDTRPLGSEVTAGSFTVNGQSISVDPADTLSDVLARITNSTAGVTATYDSASRKVVLTSVATGSTGVVDLGEDTSGLLAKLHLSLDPVTGTDGGSGIYTPLSRIPQFAGVTAGTLTVNGTDIAIDPAQTLDEVMAAINAVDGVSAVLTTGGRLRIQGAAGTTVQLADTSGFLDAASIATGLFAGSSTRGSRLGRAAAQHVARETLQVRDALAAVLRYDATAGLTGRLRTDLTGLLAEGFGVDGVEDYFGISGLDDTSERRSSVGRLARDVRTAYTDVRQVWLGDRGRGGDDGLIERMRDLISERSRDVWRLDVRL